MDPVLDRVRAANPASEDDFTGLADFEALTPPPRRRRLWLAAPALGAVIAALVVLPASAPQASEVLERAVNAVAVDDGILQVRSRYSTGSLSGSREVWVLGDTAMRSKEGDGGEEVFAAGEGTTRRDATGAVTRHPGVAMVPTEIFRVRGLLERARDVGLEETDEAYVLRWNERSGPPHWPTIEMTLWIDKATYAPLRFTDHSYGTAADGKPFDETYTEEIVEFETLPDTPENRKLLELR